MFITSKGCEIGEYFPQNPQQPEGVLFKDKSGHIRFKRLYHEHAEGRSAVTINGSKLFWQTEALKRIRPPCYTNVTEFIEQTPLTEDMRKANVSVLHLRRELTGLPNSLIKTFIGDAPSHFVHLKGLELLGSGATKKAKPYLHFETGTHIAAVKSRADVMVTNETLLADELRECPTPTTHLITAYPSKDRDFVKVVSLQELCTLLPAIPTAQMLYEMADALFQIHEKGFAHGDLKLENFLLDNKGRILLSDFGLTQNSDDEITQYGNEANAAPEFAHSQSLKAVEADAFALGALIYNWRHQKDCTATNEFNKFMEKLEQSADPIDVICYKLMLPKSHRMSVQDAKNELHTCCF